MYCAIIQGKEKKRGSVIFVSYMEEGLMKEVKSPKKPLIYYYIVILIVILLLNSFIFPAIFNQSVKEVDYGTFLDMVEQGKGRRSGNSK